MSTRDTITDFEWVSDAAPLPVNPDDPQQVERALRWARLELVKFNLEYASLLHDEEIDEDDLIALRADKASLLDFATALETTLQRQRQCDQDRLAAWNSGAPILAVEVVE